MNFISVFFLNCLFPVYMNPLYAFELLFFAVFGQTTYNEMMTTPPQGKRFRPPWTDNLFKIVFGIYMLVSVVVLINLLIAMMSDTYQRIQVIVSSPIYVSLFFSLCLQSENILPKYLRCCFLLYSAKHKLILLWRIQLIEQLNRFGQENYQKLCSEFIVWYQLSYLSIYSLQ